MTSATLERDLRVALACAGSLHGFDAIARDPAASGPLRLGTAWEPRWADPRQELSGLCARLLVFRMRAQADRLAQLETHCRQQARAAPVRAVMRALAGGDTAGARWLLSPRRRRLYGLAADLTAAACQIIADAGASDDPLARAKLLTATRYQAARDTLAAVLGDPSLAGPPSRLLAELSRLKDHTPPET